MADLLLLAMGRLPGGLGIAGMTTEADPITHLRWVRPIAERVLTPDDLRYADGALPQLGDVLRIELGDPAPERPYVENVQIASGLNPTTKVRSLSPAKRATFFSTHLDSEPQSVISRTPTRSLCLIQPDDFEAVFTLDQETDKLEARLVMHIANIPLSSQGILVTDVYWRAFGREWLRSQDEPFVEISAADVRAQLGDVFVVISLNRKGGGVIAGIHGTTPYTLALDEDNL